MNTEIIRIIRAALDGDTQNVVVYARLLAKNSEGVNASLARRIIRELDGTPVEDTIEEFE
jgi:ribosomal protein S25